MINSDLDNGDHAPGAQQDATVNAILHSGAKGAVVLAGLAAVIVVVIWFAFYLLVFAPRALTP